MYDHSHNIHTLNKQFRRLDFWPRPLTPIPEFRRLTVDLALESSRSNFAGVNPLKVFTLNGKKHFTVTSVENRLLVRKLTKNLQVATGSDYPGRNFIVSKLISLLREGIPFRVYRLDISSFFESINRISAIEAILSQRRLSPHCKKLIISILEHAAALGADGIPRGLHISSVISHLAMSDFDQTIANLDYVHYYDRYVDDIIVITRCSESPTDSITEFQDLLPEGLHLNRSKCKTIDLNERSKAETIGPALKAELEYLGYKFLIYNPIKTGQTNPGPFRHIVVDIADGKLKRIKKRIAKSVLSFEASGDFNLLVDRIKYLTSNFDITDKRTGENLHAGIYFGYPKLTTDSNSTSLLDRFLFKFILGKNRRRARRSRFDLSNKQRRIVLSHSFSKGHANRNFVNFHPRRIKTIKDCWAHG